MSRAQRWTAWSGLPAIVAALSGACAPLTMNGADQSVQDTTRVVVPAGYGTLRQDDITVPLQSGALLVKLTPLDEPTLRLLAPDTYSRLHAVRESRRDEAVRTALADPELFLVSFFSYQPDVSFQPEDVQLVYQARLLRPASVIPLTSGWGRQRLGQQETQSAVYTFEGPIDFDQTFTVRYGLIESSDWQRIVPLLETERAKIATRAGTSGTTSGR
ncbi:MAG: hypothetical protein WD054_04480 [Gemmatimonadota bacterium]